MHIFYIIILCVITFCGCSQDKGNNHFFVDTENHDFGTLGINDTCVKHSFVITNNTKDTCFIRKIDKSCGCTSVKYPYQIAPYKKGKIDVTMDTRGYTGHIFRDLYIYTSLSDTPICITMSAYIPMPIEAMKLKYNHKLFADIATNTSFLNVGNVFQDSGGYGTFEIVNFSKKEIFVDFQINSDVASIYSENKLRPLEPTKVHILYDNNFKHWGVDTLTINIVSSNNKGSIKCVAKFIPLPTFKKNKEAPRGYLPSKKIIATGKTVKDFKVHNVGARKLRILDYKSSANIHILQVDTIISPSKIGTVKFSTENKGKGFIDILTNDPYSPIYNLSIDVK